LYKSFSSAVPYIGTFLQDLTFLDENPTKISGLINFEKSYMIHTVLAKVIRFQRVQYAIQPIPSIQNLIFNNEPPDEKDLYNRSLELEQKGIELDQTSTLKKSMTRLGLQLKQY